jgi:hypothetical protein
MPSLDDAIVSAAKRIPAPGNATSTLYDLWVSQSKGGVPSFSRLGGCGSDYCSFVCHLGVASADIRFENDEDYPMYHRFVLG